MTLVPDVLKPKVGNPQAVQIFSRRISSAVLPKHRMYPYNFYNVHPAMLAQVRRLHFAAPVGEDMRRAVATGAAAVRLVFSQSHRSTLCCNPRKDAGPPGASGGHMGVCTSCWCAVVLCEVHYNVCLIWLGTADGI